MPETKIREITELDLDNGFLDTLDSLRLASNLKKDLAKDVLKKILYEASPEIGLRLLYFKIIFF